MSRTPSFLDQPPRAPTRRREWGVVAVLALALLLQLLAVQRDALAGSARWRPLVESGCGLVGCALPAWREPAAFAMLSREVIAVPDRPGTLRVQASIRNDARWSQPWPALVLTLSDADGRVLGTRRFLASDYLGARLAKGAMLAPGQAGQIGFDIVEPAAGVVGFDFRFD